VKFTIPHPSAESLNVKLVKVANNDIWIIQGLDEILLVTPAMALDLSQKLAAIVNLEGAGETPETAPDAPHNEVPTL
jgi:hypothetical protein